MILEGKTVVVCGVGQGLGGEIARLCLRDGASVMLAARTEATLEQIAKQLDPDGKRVAWQVTDITDDDQCKALAAASVDRFGGIDALVQVAAYDSLFGTFEEVKADDWRQMMEINLIGSTQVARAVVPAMKRRRGGSIVLIGSQASFLPLTSQVAYAASKGALHTAMYFMAKELGPDGIRVNTVVPTWMWGPPVQMYIKMMAKQRGISEDEVVAEITDRMCIKQIPADEDVAESVVFFCSDRARFITGQALMVNSGELMR
ncbi:MAG: SDR family oxidoreductase [Myxococcales bacterium]|nr:SDR family oxidoreductase [Myxococcales bacterium]